MSHQPIRLSVLVLLAPLALGACSVNLNAEKIVRREDKRFRVTGKPEVVLRTFDGSISVQPWDEPEVLVTIERQAGDEASLESIQVNAQQDGNRISVEVVKPEGREGFTIGYMGRSANLIVSLPREADLEARSGDGSITIESVTGRIHLNTGDGSVKGRALAGDLSVRTGDGSVSLDDVRGRLELTTGDGGVQVSGELQRLNAHTGDGSVTVRAARGSTTAEDWEITTGDGGVTLELPDAFGAELDARTGDGRISVDGLGLSGQLNPDEKDHLKARIGSGGKRLVIRTGDGPIRLSAR
jgi:Putative adhesin